MTPEQHAWASLQPRMSQAGLDPRRVENVVGPGHPDVNYAGGEIELKALAEWPRRPFTEVKLTEFSGEQAGWLAQRWLHKGAAWLMVRVNREWFLFDGWTAMEVWRGAEQARWRELAVWSWNTGLGWNEPGGLPLLTSILRLNLAAVPGHVRARLYRLTCFGPGGQPVSTDHVEAELGWPAGKVARAEQGVGQPVDVDDLLAFWEN